MHLSSAISVGRGVYAVYSFPPIPPYSPGIADLFWVVAANLLMDGYDEHETTHMNVYIKNEAVKNLCMHTRQRHIHTQTHNLQTHCIYMMYVM